MLRYGSFAASKMNKQLLSPDASVCEMVINFHMRFAAIDKYSLPQLHVILTISCVCLL